MARILGNGTRQRSRVFNELQSYYLFEDLFGRPGKGKVEHLVGFIRSDHLVPVPHVESLVVLNDDLAAQCRRRLNDRLRRHTETIGERFGRDRGAFMPLPPSSYDACDRRPGRVSSLSLVRYCNDEYSVPVRAPHLGISASLHIRSRIGWQRSRYAEPLRGTRRRGAIGSARRLRKDS